MRDSSILNKVTAENFTQQTQRILNVGIDSPKVLQIIVNLLFIKATDEPKFTSLYAQICLKLVANSPNFEPSSSTNSTFRILLLKRCEDEFRARTELKNVSSIVRARCLGNLRFIGELGRLNLMPEKILYDCVRELLSSKSRCLTDNSSEKTASKTPQELQDYESDALAADMECLCQFLTTVGQHIDSPKAKNLMNQFFDRLKRILARSKSNQDVKPTDGHCVQLPARIRFMIDDLLDLRENHWVPRRAGQRGEVNKPRYLKDIRYEVAFESGTILAPTRSERAENQRDVPGSGYVPPALAKVKPGILAGPGVNPEMWMELNRMGEALCRRANNFDLMTHTLNPNEITSSSAHNRVNNRFTQQKKNNTNVQVEETTNGVSHQVQRQKLQNRYQNGDESSWTRGIAGGQNLPPRLMRKAMTADASTTNFSHPPGIIPSSQSVDSHFPKQLESTVNTGKSLSSVIGVNPDIFNSTFEPTYLRNRNTNQVLLAENQQGSQNALNVANANINTSKNVTVSDPKHGKSYSSSSNSSTLNLGTASPVVESQSETKLNARAIIELLLEFGFTNQASALSKMIARLQEIIPLTQLNQDMLTQLFINFSFDNFGLNSSNRAECLYLWGSLLTRARQESFLASKEILETQLLEAWHNLVRNILPTQRSLSKSNLSMYVAVLILCGHIKFGSIVSELVSGRLHPLFLLILQQLNTIAKLFESSEETPNIQIPLRLENTNKDSKNLLYELIKESHIKIHLMMPDGSQTPDRLVKILEDRGLLHLCPELKHLSDYRKLVSAASDGDGQYSMDCLIDFLTSNQIDLDTVSAIHCLMCCVFNEALINGPNSETWNSFWTGARQLAKHSFLGQDNRQFEALDCLAIYQRDRNLSSDTVKNLLKALVGYSFIKDQILFKWLKDSRHLSDADVIWAEKECVILSDELSSNLSLA